MSAPRTTTKTCENPACRAEFTKPPKRTWKDFEARRYCGRDCAFACIDNRRGGWPADHPSRATRAKQAPAVPVVRELPVWRPPGWSAVPNTRRSA